MKLHYLEFEGIGPFRDRVRINFAELGVSGLFLLEGNTGSGKSTIVDAIVFALYGNVAGTDGSKERLRSHFLEPQKTSYVDLFFEVPHGIYRVRRTPNFMRPTRKDPSKMTTVNATVKVWKLNSADALASVIEGNELAEQVEPIASRAEEAGRVIASAIGLTRDQFTQTVVLPQGEFARFLKANTKDRKEVLERVFGTEFYNVIEEEFRKARINAGEQVKESISGLRAGFERLLEAAAFTDDQRAEALEAAGEFTVAGIEAAEETGKLALAHGKESETAARSALDAANKAVEVAENKHQALVDQRELVKKRRELDTMLDRRSATSEAASTAQKLVAAHDAAEQPFYALAERDKAKEQRNAAAAALPEAQRGAPEEWEKTLTAAEAAYADTSARASELASLVQREKALPEREKACKEAAEAVARARTAHQKASTAVSARPDERAALVEKKQELARAQEGADTLLANVNEWKAKAAAAHKAIGKHKDLTRARESVEQARKAATDALAHVTRLRQGRIDAMAIELASKLADGSECPVCGSMEHPRPATTDGELVSDEQIDAADQERERLNTALQEKSQQATRIMTELDAALDAAGVDEGERDSVKDSADALTALHETAKASHAEAVTAHDAAANARAEHAAVEETLEKFDARTAELDASANNAKVQLERAATHEESLAAQLTQERAELAKAREDHPSVAAKQARLREQATKENEAVTKLRAAEQARARHAELAQVAADAVTASDFADDTAVRAARLTPQRKNELAETISAFSALESRIKEASANPALEGIDASDERVAQLAEHIDASTVAVKEARDAYTHAAATHQERGSIVARTASALTRFRTLVETHHNTSAHHAAVLHLANVATANSADAKARIGLATFVVMRRFERVVEAANARLATLGDAHYELVLAEATSKGNAHVGLELEVIDRRTDERRNPASLSGGETFYVSLALALGLADIVAAESGGTEMSTLFIDEGFGSLDAETLDIVIAEIRHLGQHGRTVGIVSHVAELKTQIAEKIHVQRTADGTSEAIVTV